MDEKQKYLTIWQQAVKNASEALKSGNIDASDKYVQEMEDAYERYKEAADYETTTSDANFATLNYTLESAMPYMLNNNAKAVKNVIKLIKEDNNLLTQYKFFNALKEYNAATSANDYLNESLNLLKESLDYKTLKQSNKKLANFILKNGIKPMEEMNESMKSFIDSCTYLIEHKKTLTNLTEVALHSNKVSSYIEKHKKELEAKPNIMEMAADVNKKINSLNESERNLVNDIIAAKTNVAEQKRKGLFGKIKAETINQIDKLIQENVGEDKERLLNLKETILNMNYNKETIIEQVAKLLEIGSILSDNKFLKFN